MSQNLSRGSATLVYRSNYDPEGIFSTIPAIATALMGNLLGFFILNNEDKKKIFSGVLIVGIFVMILGWIWGGVFPINKSLWTSSYVLWTAGIALILFACLYWVLDIKKYLGWQKSFETLGRYAMLTFVLNVVFLKIQAKIYLSTQDSHIINLKPFLTDLLFSSVSAEQATMLYSLTIVVIILSIILMKEYCKPYASLKSILFQG